MEGAAHVTHADVASARPKVPTCASSARPGARTRTPARAPAHRSKCSAGRHRCQEEERTGWPTAAGRHGILPWTGSAAQRRGGGVPVPGRVRLERKKKVIFHGSVSPRYSSSAD